MTQNIWDMNPDKKPPKPKNPCWVCEIREAEVLDPYCKQCNENAQWINDFYEQFNVMRRRNGSMTSMNSLRIEMTHDELLAEINARGKSMMITSALRAVVELHKPRTDEACCVHCSKTGFWIAYPCPTIQAIEKELK